jgi:hypothetical protein
VQAARKNTAQERRYSLKPVVLIAVRNDHEDKDGSGLHVQGSQAQQERLHTSFQAMLYTS